MNSTNTMSNMSNTNPPTARRRSSFQQFERRCSLASLPEDELLELDDDGSMHSVPNVARRRSSGNANFLALGGFSSSAGLSLSLGEFDSDAHLNYGDDAGGPPVVDLPRDFGLDALSSSSFNSSGAAVVFAKGDDGSDVSETDNILNRALHDDGNANHCSSSNNNIMNNDNSNSSLLNSSRSSFKPCKIKRGHSSNRNAKRRGSLNSSNSTAGGASHRSSSHRSSYSHRSSHSTRSSQHSQLTMRSHQTIHSWKFGEWEYSSHVNCSANSTYSGHSYCSDGLSSLYQVLDMGDDETAHYESGGSAVDLSDFYEDADGGMGIGVDTSDANLGGNETTNKSSNANDGTDGEDGAKTRGTAKVTTAGKKGLECATKTTADNFTASAFHNFHRKSSCGSNDRSCNSQSCEDNCDEKSTTLQDNIMSKATTITKPTTDKFAVTAKASELLSPKTLELKKSNSTGSTTFPSSSFNENPLQPSSSSSSSSKPYIRAASAGSATLRGETQTLAALTLQTQPSRSTFTAGMTTATATTYAVAAATGIKRRTIQETLRKDEESFAASLASLRLSNGMPRKQTDGVEGAEEVTLGMGFGAGDTMFGEEWEREQWSLEEKNQTLVGTEMLMPNPQRQRRKQLQTEGMVDGNGRMSSDGTIATATTTFPEYSNRDDFKARLDVRT